MFRRQGIKALAFLAPSLAGLALFNIVPVLASLALSFTDWSGISRVRLFHGFITFVSDKFVGLKNYQTLLSDPEFWTVLGHNCYFIVLYLPLVLALSLAVSLIIQRKSHASKIYRIIYYIPVLTSWVAGALIWKWMLSPEYGPINNALKAIGITGPLWLQSETWAMPSIVLASVWKDMGFYGMILLSGLLSINPDYYEAANIDGAGPIRKFFGITLPLLSPILFYVIMLSLINAFQLFPQVMVMTKSGEAGPNGVTMVMVERIYKYAFKFGRMGYATAWSWALFVIIFAFTALQNVLQKRWVHYES
ncbi:MAG: sugar ABC transporter permease [Clostridiales bacterium]|jgi:multiple sugar transport system permease protein|nr:sugar ABC transporter permease [Clostridiales bacterium]